MRKVKAYSSASKDERAVAAWELLNAVMLAPFASIDPPERLLQYPETVRCISLPCDASTHASSRNGPGCFRYRSPRLLFALM